jgi:hypothetical protein
MTQIIHQVTLLFRGKTVSFPIGEQNAYATSEIMVNQQIEGKRYKVTSSVDWLFFCEGRRIILKLSILHLQIT